MPVLKQPDYHPSFPFTSGHVQTLYPTLFRKRPYTSPERERMELEDGDFIDVDWHFSSPEAYSEKLVVISHGLEGDSRKKNVLGLAAVLTSYGWDVLCFNFRGCSGEINRLPRLYHSGVTDDLHRVLCHGLERGGYPAAALAGFSMGGNQTLKYLGESPELVPKAVQAAAVFSVPVMLAEAGAVMARWTNRIYMLYFMRGLRQKVRKKAVLFPEIYDTIGLDRMSTFAEFDDKYTGPVHGFSGAADYYTKCSARQFLANIRVPTLLVQAKDDPFLPKSCYPYREAQANDKLFLEVPKFGGHVGFITTGKSNRYWLDDRAALFFREIIGDPAISRNHLINRKNQ